MVSNLRIYEVTLGVPGDEMNFPHAGITTLAREQRERERASERMWIDDVLESG